MHKEVFDAYIYMRISDNGELPISSYCMADNFLGVVIFMIFVVNLTVTKISTIKSYCVYYNIMRVDRRWAWPKEVWPTVVSVSKEFFVDMA